MRIFDYPDCHVPYFMKACEFPWGFQFLRCLGYGTISHGSYLEDRFGRLFMEGGSILHDFFCF